MKTKIIFSILIIIVLLIAGCNKSESPTKFELQKAPEKIVLGAMFPLSGDAAVYGDPISKQMMLAVDEINKAGGINGKKIEIKIEDSKCNPKDGATAAQKLIEVDNVKVIFGGACSGETLGAAPIAEQNKVILISPSATSPDITTAGDYIFRTAPSDAFAGKVSAEKAVQMGFEKAAIIYETTDYAQGLRRVFEKNFLGHGKDVVAVESYSSDDTDFKTQILKIVQKHPDVVYIVPQTPQKLLLLIKQIKEQKLKAQLFTGELLMGKDVIKDHGSELEGVIGVETAFDEKGEIASKALEEYNKKYGPAPWPFYQVAMRDAVYLIKQAIEKNGLDTDKIKQELYATKDWNGAIGKLTLDANGDALLGYSVKQVKDGVPVEIK